jgi:phytoene desaturase
MSDAGIESESRDRWRRPRRPRFCAATGKRRSGRYNPGETAARGWPHSDLIEEGFKFDLGPTFFLYPRILSEIYATAGYDLRAEVPMVKLDPQYRLVFGAGGELLATPDIERMEQSIAKLCPHDAANFRSFIDENREKLARFRPCLESPFSSWRDLCSPQMLKLLPLLRPWLSLDRELGRHFADERMRLAFSFQSKYLGMSPFRCPSLFSILAFLEYEAGVWHPVGGCGAVTKNMASVAKDMGVRSIWVKVSRRCSSTAIKFAPFVQKPPHMMPMPSSSTRTSPEQ